MLAIDPLLVPMFVFMAAVLGAIIGSFLNVVAWRVPRDESINFPASHCPNCNHPIRPWHNVPVLGWLVLRGRCYDCRAPISAQYPLIELTTAVLFALVTRWLLATQEHSAALIPFGGVILYLVSVSVVLSVIDAETGRLPDKIVLPSYLVVVVGLLAASVLGAGADRLTTALIGGAALFAMYGLIVVIRPDGMGLGDVKLAGVLGMLLGWFGVENLAVGAFAAFLIGGVFTVLLMLVGGAGRRTEVPFGPWMIVGAWVGVFYGGPLAAWYLHLFGLDIILSVAAHQ